MNKSEKDRRKSKTRRRKPKQTRGQQTCERILEAARLLFAQRGYEATTTHQVAQRAGISVGGLYRYFGDKEAILKEVYEQEMSALRSRILAIFVEVDLFSEDVGALVAKVMKLAFEAYKQDAGLLRVLGEQSRKIPELARARRSQAQDVQRAVRQILEAAPAVKVPDQEIGAYLISLFLESLIEDCVLYREGRGRFAEQRIVAGAVDFILRYVQGAR